MAIQPNGLVEIYFCRNRLTAGHEVPCYVTVVRVGVGVPEEVEANYCAKNEIEVENRTIA